MKQETIIKIFDITRQTWTNWKKQDKKIVKLLNYFQDKDIEHLIEHNKIPKLEYLNEVYTHIFEKYSLYVKNIEDNDTLKDEYISSIYEYNENYEEIYRKIFLFNPIFFIFKLIEKGWEYENKAITELVNLIALTNFAGRDYPVKFNNLLDINNDIEIILGIFYEEKNFELFYEYMEYKDNDIVKKHKYNHNLYLEVEKINKSKLSNEEKIIKLKELIPNEF